MSPSFWRLKYANSVVSQLYALREAGHQIHNAIKALQFIKDPWLDHRPITQHPGRYEFEIQGYWVGFEKSTNPEDKEPTLRILYVKATID